MELSQKRIELGKYWDELIGKHGGRVFAELGESPEVECSDIMSQYKWALDWYDECYKPLLLALGEAGVNVAAVSINNNSSTEKERIRNDLYWYSEIAPNILLLCSEFNDVLKSLPILNKTYDDLQMCETDKQDILFELKKALENEECEKYKDSYSRLNNILHKSDLLDKRNEWLNRIGDVAPEWANAISLRTGIHGEEICPENIDEAWMWKQFNMIVEKILDEPYDSFQKQLVSKGKRLHEVTAALVAQKAWCSLLIRTNENQGMKRSLNEWKGLQERIGKGTGKRAPKLRKQAREMMAECQNAVPAWIMPMSKALESFDATKNQFDVVIVDEASQSDITAFAIVYLAKKAIIVGDDKQVSPMAIGQEENIIESLQEKYLKGVFSAWKLYDGKTSLYSMAKLTFSPLMLKEHFRCVPEIIGYSNNLSYDGKIKPLRDASESKLLPAIISYRVDGGVREQPQKINRLEAKTISALIKACIESEEYKEKTFGVISLLGNEQAKVIETEISNQISPVVIEERQILCGNASHFQGDERDVIFLSMVDSNEGEGPLSKKTEGAGDSNKQRYNVAVSRAKDQLWIVHSLDYKNDLKSEDIRRDLLEYAEDPDSLDRKNKEIEKDSESPFEEEVAKRLVADGYNIEQQYRVGAYRIDMVVKCGNKKIALECDGEAFHSTDEQIRNDMERQTILERMGWRFIRVRGIEYYSDPDKAIHRIEAELDDYDIKPERDDSNITSKKETSDLLERVKIRAFELLKEEDLEMTSEEVESQEDDIVDTQESIDAETDDIHTDNEEKSPKEEPVDVIEGQLEMDVEHETPEIEVSGTEENVIIDDEPGTDLFDKLDEYGFGYIDHIDKSGILWIPLTVAQQESKREVLETLLKRRNLQYSYEARGAIATNNKPSYRVMISRKG